MQAFGCLFAYYLLFTVPLCGRTNAAEDQLARRAAECDLGQSDTRNERLVSE